MRITTNMVSNQIIENLNIDLARLHEVHQQVSSGKRVNKPSDDPLAAHRIVNLEEALAGVDQYQRNSDYVMNWISASETALQDAADTLMRANTLAVRGANDATLGQEELNAIADEVNGLLEHAFMSANVTSEGKYIFGGYQTQSTPFTAVMVAGEITAVNYVGDSGVEQIEIDLGYTVNRNIPGDTVFQPAAGVDIFATLINLRDDLRAGNIPAVRTAIGDTQNARQQIMNEVAALGNKTNLLEITNENMAERKLGLITLNSKLADVDMPDAIVRLQTAQDVYSVALQSSARILEQPSLMNFLS